MGNRLIVGIFSICVLMGILLIFIITAEPAPNGGGLPHPHVAGMQIGADGAARLASIGAYAFLFQSLLLLLIVCLCSLGISPRYRDKSFYSYMTACYGIMLFIWWQMYSGHQQFLATGHTDYFMGFPVPTAWQMYGTWLCAIPLILIYTLGFRKFIYTYADDEAFKAILADNKANSSD